MLRVMLSSESFSELLTKYRYLYLASYRDRSLLAEVETLEEGILDQTSEIQKELSRLSSLQYSGLEEVMTLRNIENTYQETLLDFRKEKDSTSGQIEKLAADESRIGDLIESLESRRAELARRAADNSGEEPFDPSKIALMDWPVRGPLIYNFGIETRSDGNVFRWDGIGIQAEIGTPVHAVRSGTVVLAGPFEGYGPTVVLSHGAGFYTLYLYLENIRVGEGRSILEGEILGSVGGNGTLEGPHIEFQVRIPIEEGRPEAQDPLKWLIP
jgi:septal ring factor EnvC (AmiA/AmiB activator)